MIAKQPLTTGRQKKIATRSRQAIAGLEMVPSPSSLAVARSSTFLAGLEEAAMCTILAAANIRRISAKHAITTAGDKATHLFLVRSGRARYYHATKSGHVVHLARLAAGDVIGLVALLKTQTAYMASTEAASDCELWMWDRTAIGKVVSLYPVLGENALRIALGYLKNYMERHVGLVTNSAKQRLAETLCQLGHQSGDVHPDGIEIRVTNDELGALADISRFTTSRLLSDWVRSGTVSKRRGRILLHAPEALMTD